MVRAWWSVKGVRMYPCDCLIEDKTWDKTVITAVLRKEAPQEALRGVIRWTFLEPLGRFCQHLARIAHVS